MTQPPFWDRTERLPQARALRARSHELLAARPGEVVLDVGCGTGHAVGELAENGVKVVGVDASEELLSLARTWFPGCEFRRGPAENLPVESSSVDCYRAQRLFHLLAEPQEALAEARRVLVPHGRILLIGQEYGMWTLDSANDAVTAALLRAHTERHSTRWGGRTYRNLLLDNGFTDVCVEVETAVHTDHATLAPLLTKIAEVGVAAGAVTSAQAADWLDDQADRGARGRFLAVVPMFLVIGRRS
ncbi:methyltransferase domain-containing protein [Allokutzneria oryzae]|uniref:Methyltransferase domain-containing protein n=1 Tax=Allokutzneria oryzae TaxID=1378989 RepID=A0ABV5ZNV7_9PSEU